MTIYRPKLYDVIWQCLEKQKFSGIDDKSLCEYLLKKIAFHNPLENVIYKSPQKEWIGLPKDKSLLYSSNDCGIPIGNITSQLFGNVYLNSLDHYVKRKLRVKYYGRYVDDFFLMHEERDFLLDCMEQIRIFLQNEMRLILHPKKWSLQPIRHGFQFLGAYILPGHIYPNRRVETNFRNYLKRENYNKAQWDSYMGYFENFDCFKRIEKIITFTLYNKI